MAPNSLNMNANRARFGAPFTIKGQRPSAYTRNISMSASFTDAEEAPTQYDIDVEVITPTTIKSLEELEEELSSDDASEIVKKVYDTEKLK